MGHGWAAGSGYVEGYYGVLYQGILIVQANLFTSLGSISSSEREREPFLDLDHQHHETQMNTLHDLDHDDHHCHHYHHQRERERGREKMRLKEEGETERRHFCTLTPSLTLTLLAGMYSDDWQGLGAL